MLIRPAVLADAAALSAIYNQASSATPAHNLVTWQESLSDREQWLRDMEEEGYPLFVAVEDDAVLGWAAYFQFVTPAIYFGTVENSIYLAPQARGKGVGTKLLRAVIDAAAQDEYVQTMISYIVDHNEASIALHQKLGFVETGRMPNIHTKDGHRLGLVHLQLDFPRDSITTERTPERAN
ncbi:MULTISPECIES: GNAT family N-acetyltransferase [Corynebacterium]|uniref:Phosphinothricin acetyltransferase n=1 Tax=Corynebacterium flavescens TaxID=28028 RepID=A0A1L7CKT9_CORFL|nr:MULTISPECIES: GNAT family N-acetyltransferase [Corynebacterium]APT86476.1 phosphinothricin acetyltransferase [Corynebacterium flavescens]KAA8723684.1 N-acetyltransferase family protein [Corynebacterium flavescens]MDN6099318.1 N-acetyltransferase family protein [Corynebacterium flavescens]MDN6198662.1 N-acetyltransferase family protein [Corynebacterium flavescens]MDN6225354.1 N-acetyltransferase family protein [Corynebacterium flavescens]